jgi:uncharacterized SAM-binding protein YcdF (DUF218 family)
LGIQTKILRDENPRIELEVNSLDHDFVRLMRANLPRSVFERPVQQRSARIWRQACLTLLVLMACLLLSWAAAKALIVRSDLARADAIAVLAGSATYLERTDRASKLFKEVRAPVIILTNDNVHGGWSAAEQRNPLMVELAAEELRRKGVPAEKIEIITETASSTHEEALRLREYAINHDLRSVLVVTSSYHSRRALWTLRRVFEGSGIEIGLDTPGTGVQTPVPAAWWWHSRGWQIVPGEYAKIIYYRIKY